MLSGGCLLASSRSKPQTGARRAGRAGWTKKEVRGCCKGGWADNGLHWRRGRCAGGCRGGADSPSCPCRSGAQDETLRRAVGLHGAKNWRTIGACRDSCGQLSASLIWCMPDRWPAAGPFSITPAGVCLLENCQQTSPAALQSPITLGLTAGCHGRHTPARSQHLQSTHLSRVAP